MAAGILAILVAIVSVVPVSAVPAQTAKISRGQYTDVGDVAQEKWQFEAGRLTVTGKVTDTEAVVDLGNWNGAVADPNVRELYILVERNTRPFKNIEPGKETTGAAITVCDSAGKSLPSNKMKLPTVFPKLEVVVMAGVD